MAFGKPSDLGSHRGLGLGAACLAVALLGRASGATAEESPALEAALAAYRAGQLDRAAEGFEAALEAPGNGPAELALIHRHLGVLRAASGDAGGARAAFEAALAIDPDQEAPAALGGDQRRAFEEAQAARGGEALAVEVRPPPAIRPGEGAEVSVAALRAPEGLVAGLRLRVRAPPGQAEWTVRLEGAGPQPVVVPASTIRRDGATRLEAEALDRHGGVLARSEVALLVSSVEAPIGGGSPDLGAPSEGGTEGEAEPGPGDAGGHPDRDLTWVWVTAGVVGGLIVIVAAALLIVTFASEHSYEVGAPRVE